MKKILFIISLLFLQLSVITPVNAQLIPNDIHRITFPTKQVLPTATPTLSVTPSVEPKLKDKLTRNVKTMYRNLNAYSRIIQKLKHVSVTNANQFKLNVIEERKNLRELIATISASTDTDTLTKIQKTSYKDALYRYKTLRMTYQYASAFGTPYAKLTHYQRLANTIDRKLQRAKSNGLDTLKLDTQLDISKKEIAHLYQVGDKFITNVVFASPNQVAKVIKGSKNETSKFFMDIDFGYDKDLSQLTSYPFSEAIAGLYKTPKITSISEQMGTLGSTLIIKGSNLKGDLYFYTIPTRYVQLDVYGGSQITVTVPSTLFIHDANCYVGSKSTNCNKTSKSKINTSETLNVVLYSSGTSTFDTGLKSNVVTFTVIAPSPTPNKCVVNKGTCIAGNTCPNGSKFFDADSCQAKTLCCVPIPTKPVHPK